MRTKTKDRITPQQEKFIAELLKGKTQRHAYLAAYPKYKNWKPSSLDAEASKLWKQPKIRQRYDELLEKYRESEQQKVKWTREESVKALRFVVEANQREIERIEQAAEDELDALLVEMNKNPNKATTLMSQYITKKKAKRISMTNNKGITDAVSELNKMQGFNEETINVHGAVVFTGEELLED